MEQGYLVSALTSCLNSSCHYHFYLMCNIIIVFAPCIMYSMLKYSGKNYCFKIKNRIKCISNLAMRSQLQSQLIKPCIICIIHALVSVL